MGRRRIEVVGKIACNRTRKVTYCKRKKGLLKKAMELSLLCDVNIYLYMHDRANNRVVHFQSNAEADLRQVFKTRSSREFYSNEDYVRLNGMESLNSLSYANDKEEVKNSEQEDGSGTVSEDIEEDPEKRSSSPQQKSDEIFDLDQQGNKINIRQNLKNTTKGQEQAKTGNEPPSRNRFTSRNVIRKMVQVDWTSFNQVLSSNLVEAQCQTDISYTSRTVVPLDKMTGARRNLNQGQLDQTPWQDNNFYVGKARTFTDREDTMENRHKHATPYRREDHLIVQHQDFDNKMIIHPKGPAQFSSKPYETETSQDCRIVEPPHKVFKACMSEQQKQGQTSQNALPLPINERYQLISRLSPQFGHTARPNKFKTSTPPDYHVIPPSVYEKYLPTHRSQAKHSHGFQQMYEEGLPLPRNFTDRFDYQNKSQQVSMQQDDSNIYYPHADSPKESSSAAFRDNRDESNGQIFGQAIFNTKATGQKSRTPYDIDPLEKIKEKNETPTAFSSSNNYPVFNKQVANYDGVRVVPDTQYDQMTYHSHRKFNGQSSQAFTGHSLRNKPELVCFKRNPNAPKDTVSQIFSEKIAKTVSEGSHTNYVQTVHYANEMSPEE